MTGQITLKDVAAHAGVSRTTASYVVMGTGRVSQKTRDRVNQSIRTLGYVYNRGAASLRTQRSGTIGVIVTNIASPFFGELLVGLESELSKAGFLSLIVATADDPQRQDELVKALREHQVAGLALVPASGTGSGFLHSLKDWGVPHILMTRYLDGITAPYVGADDVLGGRLAAEHLLAHGCKSFAYLGGPVKVLSRRDRIAGARGALAEYGLGPDALLDMPGETSGPGGLALGEQLLARPEPLPDAIICHSDSVAFGLYRALRMHGRTNDVRVIGYDDVSGAALWEPPLTSIATHGEDLGRTAARLLLDQLNDAEGNMASTIALPELIVRESCGCPATP
ncbi:LacI family DNA-binding transcriptional regulator [Arthrobacter sp. 35W]|uniref:LacI family DNA-binding transcriptional regulator n=1 Tax=Arthrobacter sp. 35W TaxID=1132441 RepID=UPI000551E961|nr:LacI family DNA-binding transcriptional regulator [Arthrobacter sp. 35W]